VRRCLESTLIIASREAADGDYPKVPDQRVIQRADGRTQKAVSRVRPANHAARCSLLAFPATGATGLSTSLVFTACPPSAEDIAACLQFSDWEPEAIPDPKIHHVSSRPARELSL